MRLYPCLCGERVGRVGKGEGIREGRNGISLSLKRERREGERETESEGERDSEMHLDDRILRPSGAYKLFTHQIIIIHIIVDADISFISYLFAVSYVAIWQNESRLNVSLIIWIHCHITDWNVDLFLRLLGLEKRKKGEKG